MKKILSSLFLVFTFVSCEGILSPSNDINIDLRQLLDQRGNSEDDEEVCELVLDVALQGNIAQLAIDGNSEPVFLFIDEELHPEKVENEDFVELTEGIHELFVQETADCQSNIETVEVVQ